jgi:hypothetical protein
MANEPKESNKPRPVTGKEARGKRISFRGFGRGRSRGKSRGRGAVPYYLLRDAA